MPERLEVGRIGRAHGLHGEVTVTLTSERTDRVAPGSVLHAGERALTVVSSRPHQGRWLVRFEGVDDRTAAESLRGERLTADARPGDEGELWVNELAGRPVLDRAGARLGVVVAVESNPASDLLVIETATGREALVPLVFVVDARDEAVVVDPPEGLLDVNG